MKPFDLQAALRGDLVVTRDGREVKDVRHLPSAYADEQIVGTIDGLVVARNVAGGSRSDNRESDNDFMMAPRTRKIKARAYRYEFKGDIHLTTNVATLGYRLPPSGAEWCSDIFEIEITE